MSTIIVWVLAMVSAMSPVIVLHDSSMQTVALESATPHDNTERCDCSFGCHWESEAALALGAIPVVVYQCGILGSRLALREWSIQDQ
eukprot:scaffold435065_cov59-Attheya_sp.AAC.2